MKVAAHQVASLLNDPSQVAGILFYGEDTGRIRDHVAAATQGVIGTTTDPFRYSVLTREEHARLRGEIGSLALGGGRRVVRVQDATDSLAAVLEGLASHRADTLVLLEAGTLTPRSKLRAMAEKHPQWAAVACYPETGAALVNDIKRILGSAGLTVEPPALAYLAQELGGDSNRRRAELEKLALYAAEAGAVSLETAQACCSTGLEATVGAAVSAAMSGRVEACDALVGGLTQDGATGPGILVMLGMEIHRVLKVRVLMADGTSGEEACRTLMPPIYPRQMAGFMQAVQRWSVTGLEALGQAVRDADIACKRAASPDIAIACRLLNMVAQRAAARS